MSPWHVLVVDDDPSLRLLCQVNLALEGFTVTEAPSLAAARAALDGAAIDVVILDLHVGSDHGGDLLRELRAERPSLPVALLTGEARIDDDLVGLADAVIPKPFAIEELGATARRLVAAGRTASDSQ